MGSDLDDDMVALKCTNPPPSTTIDHPGILISTADICAWDVPAILDCSIVTVKANRSRLIEESSYFSGLLSGSFSDSCLDCISITWNLETVINILKFIYSCPLDVTSSNFLPLFEGALFFGVEKLLLKCKAWFYEITSSKGLCSPNLELDDMIHIWKFGLENAIDFIPEICTGYLARNFMWTTSLNSFGDVPYDLLSSCLNHCDLTVDSEKDLCDALLVWVASKTECLGDGCSSHDIFQRIRKSLLPLWYAAGKRSCCFISQLADESIDAIFSLKNYSSIHSRKVPGDQNLYHLRIRLTEYSKKLDLSGCPQITSTILLLSLRTISFGAVCEVDISKCPNLDLEAAIDCFQNSFPLLRILKATCFLSFKTRNWHYCMQNWPFLSEVDLTVDISPIVPTKVSVLSSSSVTMPQKSDNIFETVYHLSLSENCQSNITKLTLEGRSDVNDSDLHEISVVCISLSYLNLKGCVSVTDDGISILIQRCKKLHSILVCDTSFGRDSILSLCSDISSTSSLPTEQFAKNHVNSLAFRLQVLHMGGCKGVDGTSLQELMSRSHMLKRLCLRGTHLFDNALYSFFGTSLEMLDVSDTMVSETALTQIVGKNHALRCLEARGCRNLFRKEIGGVFFPHSGGDLYVELGRTCKLEEISLGWGFTYFSLEILKPALTSLRAITVGLGGSLGQDSLLLLPTACPLLESVSLHFQVISDSVVKTIIESLRNLKVLALCYCLGDISSSSFHYSMPKLKKLKLERVTPWMTNDDLVVLTKNCPNLVELSLLGCLCLNSDSQCIISRGWPGLISLSLEDCGEITSNGVASLFYCKALEDISLRHNGPGISKNFILDAASKLPMLRNISLDACDVVEGKFYSPNCDRFFLSTVKVARCRSQKRIPGLSNFGDHRIPVHKETMVLTWNSENFTGTLVTERL